MIVVMKKVLAVFGTRPEAIKMCPLVLALKRVQGLECIICLTGQHKEMLASVMDIFGIREDYNLDIMQPCQTLPSITVNVLSRLDGVLEKEQPDLILVHGDTTTSFTAALAGFYRKIPIGHVEAGLRTCNMHSPYPEEFNRQAVDLVTELYFAPTKQAAQNLLREGKRGENIYVTGNTVIDALSLTVRNDYQNENLDWCKESRLILLTAHRRENLGEPMRHMFRAIKRIIGECPDVKVLYPIHKNPKVRQVAGEIFGGVERIRLIEPLDVMDFHNFMAHSYIILTDSGGIQEEAPSLGKPVLVMRDTTERPEGIEAGTLKLVGTSEENIYREMKKLLMDEKAYKEMSKASNPYGDGQASERIVRIIVDYLW
jgi:UDP-N-acetylglucosamine 2-epimerase (non-hydrolysing)